MPDEIKKYIDHIKLDNGEKYWLEDAEALKSEGGVIAGDLEVRGNLQVDTDLTVNNNTDLNGTVNIDGDTSVTGNTDITGDVSMSGSVGITGNTSINGTLSTSDNAEFNSSVEIDGKTILNNGADITGDINSTGNIISTGSLEINGQTSLNDDVTITGDISTSGSSIVAGDGTVVGDVTVVGNVDVVENTSLEGTLTVEDNTQLLSDLSVSGNAGFSKNVNISGNTEITGNTTVNGKLKTSNTLEVDGKTTLKNSLDVTGNVVVSGNETVSGDVVVTGDIKASNIAGGEQGQVLTKSSDTDFDFDWSTPVNSYDALTNKPSINGVEISGSKTGPSYGLQNTLSAGDDISISNNVVSFDGLERIEAASTLTYATIQKLYKQKAVLYETVTISGNDAYNEYIYLHREALPYEAPPYWEYTFINVDYLDSGLYGLHTKTIYYSTTGNEQGTYTKRSAVKYIPYGTSLSNIASGILKTNSTGVASKAVAGTDYIAPGDTRLVPAGGLTGQLLGKQSDTDYDAGWITPVTDYDELTNRPQINGHVLTGDQTGAELDLQDTLTAGDNIDLSNNVVSFEGLEIIEPTNNAITLDEVQKVLQYKAIIKYNNSLFRVQNVAGTTAQLSSSSRDVSGLRYSAISLNTTTGAISLNINEAIAPIDTNRYNAAGLIKYPSTGSHIIQTAVAGTDYIAPEDSRLIPSGGTVGQHLIKNSSTDYDATWQPDVVEIADLSSSVLTQDEIERLRNNAMLYVQSHDFYFNFAYEYSFNIYLYQVVFVDNRPYLRQLCYNTTTGARSSFSEKTLVWAEGFNSFTNANKLLKTPVNSTDGTKVAYATAGTDYIAPGDSRLIKSGGTEGQVITKNSSTNYDYSWQDLPKGIPDAGTTGQALVKNSNTDYDVKWGTINTYTQVHCTDAASTPINIKWNDGTSDVTGTMTASQAATNYGPKSVFLVPSSTTGTQAAGEYERSLDGNDIVYLLDVDNSTFIKTVTTQFDVEHIHTITPTITTLTAQASGTAVSNTQDTFVKSYPGQSSKMITTQITGTNGTQSVSKVTKTDGSAAVLTETITADGNAINGLQLGTLKLSWTANVPTTLTVTDYDVAKVASSSTTVATGSLDINAAGASVMTSLGNPVTANALTSSVISTQPTITLNNQPSIDVVTNVAETNYNSSRHIGD